MLSDMFAVNLLLKNVKERLQIQSKNFTKNVSILKLKNQQSDWVPHVICSLCYNMLRRSTADKKIKFTSPTLWNQPKYIKDCYF